MSELNKYPVYNILESEEERKFREEVRKFIDTEIAPEDLVGSENRPHTVLVIVGS